MKTKSMLVEAFMVAQVVLCWIVALPILALLLSGLTIWDRAVSAAVGVRGGSGRGSSFNLDTPMADV